MQIGVGKKCCWMCDRLAKALKTPDIRFQLPGTSGIIFPWAPPIGLPTSVLQLLVKDLQMILIDALRTKTDDSSTTASSQTSPSSSLGGDSSSGDARYLFMDRLSIVTEEVPKSG
jgi:hypothetical protein